MPTFAHPYFLLLLLLVPAAGWWYWKKGFRKEATLNFLLTEPLAADL